MLISLIVVVISQWCLYQNVTLYTLNLYNFCALFSRKLEKNNLSKKKKHKSEAETRMEKDNVIEFFKESDLDQEYIIIFCHEKHILKLSND